MSKDSVESHKKFKKKYKINFPLLSDPDAKVIRAYGAWKEKNRYGKKVMGVARTTYVIDEKGMIEEVFPNVKVDGHIEKVLEGL